ncbi:MAG: hypothetical protein N3G18_06560, partial [Candidatus Saccharicenans sp.]|nr:hypothetical protein [Candidatus Saccharicenans sp.]
MNTSWSSIQKTFGGYDRQGSQIRFDRDASCGLNCLVPSGNPRGSALMVCLLVMAILMTLGAGLLINSGLFLKTHGLRKVTRLTSFATENGIKQAWN